MRHLSCRTRKRCGRLLNSTGPLLFPLRLLPLIPHLQELKTKKRYGRLQKAMGGTPFSTIFSVLAPPVPHLQELKTNKRYGRLQKAMID